MTVRAPTIARDPASLDGWTALAAGLAAALPGTMLGLRLNPDLWSGIPFNPDSAMRLTRLDDILAAGLPLHQVMRDGSGGGNVIPWSHLLDSLLLLLAAPFAPLLGWHAALFWAGALSGPLSLAALGVATAWAAAPAASRGWLWVGAFAAGSAPVLRGYGALGVTHHHVLLAIVPVMAAGLAFRLLRTAPAGLLPHASASALALGAWMAFGLWLSPEAVPFSLLALGAVWAGWLASPARRLARTLLVASLSFAVLATLAWWVDPPFTGLAAIEPDRLSLPYVLLAWGAAATSALASRTGRRVPALLCGAALGIAWFAAFPQVLHGTRGLMSAAEAHAFFDGIEEMMPAGTVGEVLQCVLGGLFAAGALFAAARGSRLAETCVPLLYGAACAVLLVLPALLHIRFAAYPAVFGAVLLPVVLSRFGAGSTLPRLAGSVARAACVLLLVAVPTMSSVAASPAALPPVKCPLPGAVALLAGHDGAVVLSGVGEAPALLYATRVLTVGSLYHRNPQGFIRLQAAWDAAPGDAPTEAFRATRASLVLACPQPGTAHDAASSLARRLAAGAPPPWLRRLSDAGPGGYVLYGVAP